MKDTYNVNYYNCEAEALALKIEEQKTEIDVEIVHNIQKEIQRLKDLGFNMYYGRTCIADPDILQLLEN